MKFGFYISSQFFFFYDEFRVGVWDMFLAQLKVLHWSTDGWRQGITWAYGLILLGGGGGGGHSISLPDRFAYTVHINNFVRDFIRAFFKDFSVRGAAFFLSAGCRRPDSGILQWWFFPLFVDWWTGGLKLKFIMWSFFNRSCRWKNYRVEIYTFIRPNQEQLQKMQL